MAAREAAPPTSPPTLGPDADAAATLQRVATLQRLLEGTVGTGMLPVREGGCSGHARASARLHPRAGVPLM